MSFLSYLMAVYSGHSTGNDNPAVAILFGLIAAGVCIYILVLRIGRAKATGNLGLKVSVNPATVSRGGQLCVTMKVNPRTPVDVTQILVNLECRRSSKTHHHHHGSHHGSHHGTVVDVIAKTQSTIPIGGMFPAGKEQTMTADLIVPSDGLPTDGMGDLKIKWILTVTFDIPDTFDAEKKMEIRVCK